jgi:hypothetical protein
MSHVLSRPVAGIVFQPIGIGRSQVISRFANFLKFVYVEIKISNSMQLSAS